MAEYSIIIPIYNSSEKYLKRNLECFRDVSDRFEIIAINDGSDEKTSTLLLEYADENPAIKVLNQKNKGVSSARNRGIEEAQGKWILFCDADDELDTEKLEELMAEDTAQSADFVYTAYKKQTDHQMRLVSLKQVNNPQDYVDMILTNPTITSTVWSKLYRRSILIDENIRFHEDLTHAEDSIFLLEYLSKCTRVSGINECFYTYHLYNTSVSKSNSQAYRNYLYSLQTAEETIRLYYPEKSDCFRNFCNANVLVMLVNYIFSENTDYRQGKKDLSVLRNDRMINDSIRNYNRSNTGIYQRFALFCIRSRLDLCSYLLARIRQKIR